MLNSDFQYSFTILTTVRKNPNTQPKEAESVASVLPRRPPWSHFIAVMNLNSGSECTFAASSWTGALCFSLVHKTG